MPRGENDGALSPAKAAPPAPGDVGRVHVGLSPDPPNSGGSGGGDVGGDRPPCGEGGTPPEPPAGPSPSRAISPLPLRACDRGSRHVSLLSGAGLCPAPSGVARHRRAGGGGARDGPPDRRPPGGCSRGEGG